MHHLNQFPAATATLVTSMFDMLVHLVGTGIILISIVWSAYCLITYLIRRLAPAEFPASTPAPAAPRPADPTPAAPRPADPTLAAPGPAGPAPAAPAIPPQTIAVIAAAVQYMLGEKYKIIAIKPQDTSWEKAGRQAVLSSHRIR